MVNAMKTTKVENELLPDEAWIDARGYYEGYDPHHALWMEPIWKKRRQIAEAILRKVRWSEKNLGFCVCPGHLSSSGNVIIHDCSIDVDKGNSSWISCPNPACHNDIERLNQAFDPIFKEVRDEVW